MIQRSIVLLSVLLILLVCAVASHASPPSGILGSGPALAASSSTQSAIANMTSSLPAVVEFGANVSYGGRQCAANSNLIYCARPPTKETFALAPVPCDSPKYAASFSPTDTEMTAISTCNLMACSARQDVVVAQTGVTKSKFANNASILVASRFANHVSYPNILHSNKGWTTLKTFCHDSIGQIGVA